MHKNRQVVSALVVVVVAIGIYAWFEIEASIARRQSWEGIITDVYRTRRWWFGLRRYSSTGEYRYYNHYWRVRTKEGATIDANVPWGRWDGAKPGDRARKRNGERWPELATPQADRQRQTANQAMGLLFK